MRTIWQYRLDSDVVAMPRDARILRFALQSGKPTIWVTVDTSAPLVPRRFVTVSSHHDLGELTADGYVGSYDQGRIVRHVFEAQHADPLPGAIAALPLEAQNAYRSLRKSGYTMRDDGAWIAPTDEPMTREDMVAVAELQAHGFGSVVAK